MPDIKQRAHKMFDERFVKTMILWNYHDDVSPSSDEIKVYTDFIDEIIDMRDKEIVEMIEDGLMKYFYEKFPRVEKWQYDTYVKTAIEFVKQISKPKLSAEALNIK